MKVPPLILAIASGALLAGAVVLHPGGLAPAWLPLGLVAVGTLPASWGAARGNARVHTLGVLGQLAGLGLTGPFPSTPVVLVGTLGVVAGVGAWTLGQTVDVRSGGAVVLSTALGTALVASIVGWGASDVLAGLTGGGADARAIVPAWIVLAGAGTWMILRWSEGSR